MRALPTATRRVKPGPCLLSATARDLRGSIRPLQGGSARLPHPLGPPPQPRPRRARVGRAWTPLPCAARSSAPRAGTHTLPPTLAADFSTCSQSCSALSACVHSSSSSFQFSLLSSYVTFLKARNQSCAAGHSARLAPRQADTRLPGESRGCCPPLGDFPGPCAERSAK